MSARKQVKDTLYNLKSLLNRHEYLEKAIVRVQGQDVFDAIQQHYSEMAAKLTNEMHALPIGVRYTGTFYIKKPYSVPTEYVKIEGSAFLREDLVKWQIEDVEEYRYSYFVAVYKQPNDSERSILKKEEAEAVYELPEHAH